jgi:hypothetical protein
MGKKKSVAPQNHFRCETALGKKDDRNAHCFIKLMLLPILYMVPGV